MTKTNKRDSIKVSFKKQKKEKGVFILNSALLKSKIVLAGLKLQDISKELKLSKSAFYRKTNNLTQFNLEEIKKIKLILNLTTEEVEEIFFL